MGFILQGFVGSAGVAEKSRKRMSELNPFGLKTTWPSYGEGCVIAYDIKFHTAGTAAMNILLNLKLYTAFLSTLISDI
jgi:hypothetical protein